MNASINSLLGPLEAATRSGSWEDAEDIAGEISRLARLQRLSELKKIEEALIASGRHQKLKPSPKHPVTALRGNQTAKTPLPVAPVTPIKQGQSTRIQSHGGLRTPLGPSWSEPWPFG